MGRKPLARVLLLAAALLTLVAGYWLGNRYAGKQPDPQAPQSLIPDNPTE